MPGHDLEVRAQGLARHREVQVVSIGVECGDEGCGSFDAGAPKDFVIGHVAEDRGVGHRAQSFGITIDHHHIAPGVDEKSGHFTAHPPPPAYDHVAGHVLYCSVYSAPPHTASHVSID